MLWGRTIRVHVPFFIPDLALCKEKLVRFSEDPSKFTDEFEKLILTYALTWQDLQILFTSCTIEEKQKEKRKTKHNKKTARGHTNSVAARNEGHAVY